MKNIIIAIVLVTISFFSFAAKHDTPYNVVGCSLYDSDNVLVFVQNLQTGDVGTKVSGFASSNKYGPGSVVQFKGNGEVLVDDRGPNMSCAIVIAMANRIEIPLNPPETN